MGKEMTSNCRLTDDDLNIMFRIDENDVIYRNQLSIDNKPELFNERDVKSWNRFANKEFTAKRIRCSGYVEILRDELLLILKFGYADAQNKKAVNSAMKTIERGIYLVLKTNLFRVKKRKNLPGRSFKTIEEAREYRAIHKNPKKHSRDIDFIEPMEPIDCSDIYGEYYANNADMYCHDLSCYG